MEIARDSLVSLDRNPSRTALRSFGYALALVCLGRAVWSCATSLGSTQLTPETYAAAAGAAAAFALARHRPDVLRMPYVLLSWLSYPLRWLLAMWVLAALYFAVITPLAVMVRLARLARRTAHPQPVQHVDTAWVASTARADKSEYFRQF